MDLVKPADVWRLFRNVESVAVIDPLMVENLTPRVSSVHKLDGCTLY